jgi:hypothetical protein
MPAALNNNLAVHSKNSFWNRPEGPTSLNAVSTTTRRWTVQTGR